MRVRVHVHGRRKLLPDLTLPPRSQRLDRAGANPQLAGTARMRGQRFRGAATWMEAEQKGRGSERAKGGRPYHHSRTAQARADLGGPRQGTEAATAAAPESGGEASRLRGSGDAQDGGGRGRAPVRLFVPLHDHDHDGLVSFHSGGEEVGGEGKGREHSCVEGDAFFSSFLPSPFASSAPPRLLPRYCAVSPGSFGVFPFSPSPISAGVLRAAGSLVRPETENAVREPDSVGHYYRDRVRSEFFCFVLFCLRRALPSVGPAVSVRR